MDMIFFHQILGSTNTASSADVDNSTFGNDDAFGALGLDERKSYSPPHPSRPIYSRGNF